MSRWNKLRRLSLSDAFLLLKSFLLLVSIKLGLRLLSLKRVLRLLATDMRGTTYIGEVDKVLIKRIAWSVRVAARFVPSATCLPQALTTMVILGRLGQPASLRIGVAKDEKGKLEAHAWVESHGKIIVGRLPDLSRFSVLPSLEQELL
jgi:hypothetical protein